MSGSYFPLRDAIDRLFESSVVAPPGFSGNFGFPTANVLADDEDIVIEMAIPGAKPDDINISVTGDTVSVSGEIKRTQHEHKRAQTYIDENFHGQFQRSFQLPFPVDADMANATFENGMLALTLPKSEAVKPRKIQVNRQGTIEGESRQAGAGVQKETIPVQSE